MEHPPDARPLRNALNWLIWLSLAALVALLSLFKVSSYDVWWHLRAGEYILAHHMVPTRDVFSFLAQGRPWVTHEWLSEVLAFLAYRLGGINAVTILKAATVLLTFAVLGLTLRRLKVSTLIAAPLLAAGAFLVTFRAFERPDAVTELFCAVYLLVLLSWRHLPHDRRSWRRLLLLMPLQFVWANMHSGMVFGLAIVALFVAGEGAKRIRTKHNGTKAQESETRNSVVSWCLGGEIPGRDLLFLLGLLVGLLLVSLLNPNTWRVLVYPFMITGEASFRSQIGELQSPLGAAYRSSTFFAALVVLVIAGIASFLANRRRTDLTGLALYLAFGALGLMALRNLPVFAIVAIPVIALNLQQAASHKLQATSDTPTTRPSSGIGYLLSTIPLLLALWALVALVSTLGVNVAGLRRRPGLGVKEGMFPVGAAEFIDRNHVQGNVFNTMEFGGYLIWRWFPERQVFIDGRLDVYGRELFSVYSRVLNTAPDADSILSANGVNCLVLALPAQNEATARSYIGRTLALRPDWSLVYWDDVALVYVKRIPEHQDLIARHGYHAILPTLLGTPPGPETDPSAVLAEAQRAHDESPGPGTEAVLGFAWLGLNRVSDALLAFQRALQLNPSQTSALQGLARIDAASSDLPALVRVLNRWIAVEPENALVRYNLGRACFERRNYAAAEQALKEALRLDQSLVVAHELLGEVFAEQGKTERARTEWETTLRLDPSNAAARQHLGP
jgi:hypothetical protein